MTVPAGPAAPAAATAATAPRQRSQSAPGSAPRRAAAAPSRPQPPAPPEDPFGDLAALAALEATGTSPAPPQGAGPSGTSYAYPSAGPYTPPGGAAVGWAGQLRRKPALLAGIAAAVLLVAVGLVGLIVHSMSPRGQAAADATTADATSPAGSGGRGPSGQPPEHVQPPPPDLRAVGEKALHQFAEALNQYVAAHDGQYPDRLEEALGEPARREISQEADYHASITYLGASNWAAPLPPEVEVATWFFGPSETILFGDGHVETVDINQYNNSARHQAASLAEIKLSQQPRRVQPRRPAAPTALTFPSFGVSCPLPAGWMRVSETSDVQVFALLKIQGGKPAPDGLFRLEVGPPARSGKYPTLQSFAGFVAGSQKMRISNEAAKLGGTAAIELAASPGPAPGERALLRGLVTEHAGYYFGLYQFASADAPREAFDALASQLAWSDPKPPADALASGAKDGRPPLWLQGAGVVCNLPDPFRVSRMSADGVRCITYDLTTHAMDASLTVTYLPDADVNQTRDRAMEIAGGSAVLIGHQVWSNLPGPVAVTFTGVIGMRPTDRDPAPKSRQLVVAKLEGHPPALLLFEYQSQNADKYSRAIRAWLVSSFRSSKAYEEGRAAAPSQEPK